MHSIIYISLLFLCILLIIPRYAFIEPFDSSAELYKESIDEETYYKKLYGDGIKELQDQLLYMDRCIKIPHTEMESFMNNWVSSAKFPIIEGRLNINTYNEIEDFIYKQLNKFSKKSNKLYGPVYVLMSQAPFIRNIDDDCKITNLYIQYNYSNDEFKNQSRLITHSNDIDIIEKCKSKIDMVNNRKMSVRIYICLPTYNKKGQFIYRSWENIKCNMKELLKYRNKDKYCYMNCIGSDISCGCMSQNRPYKSRCLGDNATLDSNHYTYANLFLLNTNHVNRVLNTKLFSEENVHIYPFDNNLEYCATNKPISTLNKVITNITLETGKTYIIKYIKTNKCLYDIGTLSIGMCVITDNRYKWIVESVSESQIVFKNKATNKYLYQYTVGNNTYLGTSMISKTPFNYYNYQLTNNNQSKYVDIKDTRVSLLDVPLTNKTKIISLQVSDIPKYAYIHIQNPAVGFLEYFNGKLVFNPTPTEYQRWIFESTNINNTYKIKHYKSGLYLHMSIINRQPIIQMVSSITINITGWICTGNTLKANNTNYYITYNTPSVSITTAPYVWNFIAYENLERIWVIEEAFD